MSTGLGIQPGQQDPRWQLTAVPPNQTGAFPSYATTPYSSWVPPTSPANWIHRIQNPTPQPDSAGNYTYRLQFNLNPALYSSVQIVGNYSGDNSAFVQLNGVTKAGCGGNTCFQGLHPISITSGFVNGVNDLDIIVNNDSGPSPTGLLVEAKLQATCRACVWAPTGMVAWWPLDETSGTTVADIVGGYDGTAQPGPIGAPTGPGPVSSAFWSLPPTIPFPAGVVDTSLFFSGTRRVEVLTKPALEPGTGDFTIDAWVIYAAAGTGNYLTIAQKYSSTTAGYLLNIQDVSTTQGQLRFGVNGPSSSPQLTANIAPQTWHHVAATLQRGTAAEMALYLDGALVDSGPFGSGGSVSNNLNLLIGGDGVPGVSAGEIAVDELEIFNRALAQAEIQDIFNAGSSGKCKCVSPPSDMVSWWPFDETGGMVVHDIADGNSGTPEPGPVGSGGPTPGSGMVDGALNFNGTSDFVQVPNAPNLNFGAGSLSIDAWIQTSSRTGFMPIVDKEIAGPTDFPYGYVFYVNNGYLGFSMGNDINATSHASIGADDTTKFLADSSWHHVAITVQRNPASATGGTLFIDGFPLPTPFSTTPFAGLAADNTGDLILGSRNRLGRLPVSDFFNGRIDEVEIFNRALTQTEVRDIYRAGSKGKCKPACATPPSHMVAWYTLDETTGSTVIHDIWTYHLNGTPVPSPVGPPGPYSILGQYVNNSLYFVGSYVDVPDSPHLNFFPPGGTGEFSIDAWVKIAGSSGGASGFPVVDKTLVAGSTVKGYGLYVYSTPPLYDSQLAFTLDDGTVAVSPPPTLLDPTPLTGGWHHVAVTVARPNLTSAAVTLYVDGAPWSATIPVGNTDNNADLWIAKSRVLPLLMGGNPTEFEIDEVEIFNGVLTPQDILNIYHAGSAGKCRSADLAISIEVQPKSLVSGQQATFTITVTNEGDAPCEGVTTMIDTLPTGLQVVGVAQGGSLWNCSVAGSNPPATLTCTWDASIQPVPPGPLPPITLTTKVTAPAGSSITNCATVSNPNDTNSANDQSCVTILAPEAPRRRIHRT
ncbi:MAG: LamG-like jellyroll fold domain-containing protein [Thermoanaerobaculales bacterium]